MRGSLAIPSLGIVNLGWILMQLRIRPAAGLGGNLRAMLIVTAKTFPDFVYSNGTFTVTATPIPAAVWLFASGLGLLGAFKRKR